MSQGRNFQYINNKGLLKSIIAATVVGAVCLGAGFVIGKNFSKGIERGLPATFKEYSDGKSYATVGDTEITGKVLQKEMDIIFYRAGMSKLSDKEVNAFEENTLEYLSSVEMLSQEAKKQNIEVTDKDIKTSYDNYISLAKQTYNMNEEQYLKRFNYSKNEIEERLKKELMGTRYLGTMIKSDDKELKEYYNKNKSNYMLVRTSKILIKNIDENGKQVSADKKAKNKEKAEDILNKVKAGGDFAKLAKQFSQDNTAAEGGDDGFFTVSQVDPKIEKEAFKLKVGQTSDKLIETNYGYNIIKKTDEKQEPYSEAKERLETELGREKQDKLINKLKKEYKVTIKE